MTINETKERLLPIIAKNIDKVIMADYNSISIAMDLFALEIMYFFANKAEMKIINSMVRTLEKLYKETDNPAIIELIDEFDRKVNNG